MLTEEQKELRRSGIGGSDAAAIAGLSRYKTNIDVYLEKLGYRDSDEGGEAAYWGDTLENLVAQEYAKRNNVNISEGSALVKNIKYPWMFANVDRLFFDKKAILECKTCSAYKADEWGATDTDEIPDEYLLQCAHYRIVTECDFVAIAVLIGGQEYRQYRYEKNSNLENKLIKIEHDFWHKHVLAQEAPEPKTYEDALKLFNRTTDNKKIASEPIINYLQGYRYACDQIKEMEKQKDLLKAKIASFMGEDSILVNEIEQPLATWKPKKINRFDVELFKQKHPELYNQFIKTTQTREFRLKEVTNE